MSRLSTIRMSPDMLQAEPEGSVEPPMELASPPSLAGPPVRPTAPAPEEKKEEPRAAAPAPSFATAGSPVAPPPAVEKEAPAPAPAAPEVWTYPETFGWVKEEKGVTPADVHITQCGKCRAQYAIDLDQLGDEGKKVQCAVCNHVWFQSPMKLEELPAGIEVRAHSLARMLVGHGALTHVLAAPVQEVPYGGLQGACAPGMPACAHASDVQS